MGYLCKFVLREQIHGPLQNVSVYAPYVLSYSKQSIIRTSDNKNSRYIELTYVPLGLINPHNNARYNQLSVYRTFYGTPWRFISSSVYLYCTSLKITHTCYCYWSNEICAITNLCNRLWRSIRTNTIQAILFIGHQAHDSSRVWCNFPALRQGI